MAASGDLPRNKILVLSSSTPSTLPLPLRLVRDILHASGDAAGLPDLDAAIGAQGRPAHLSDGAILPWRVFTKYYAASLDFWAASVRPPPAPFFLPHEDWDLVGPAVDAVVLVFDPAEPATLLHLAPHIDLLDRHGPSIRLCVGYDPAGALHAGPPPPPLGASGGPRSGAGGRAAARARLLDSYRDWCTERGYEYVHVDPASGVGGGAEERRGRDAGAATGAEDGAAGEAEPDGGDGEEDAGDGGDDSDDELGVDREGVPRVVEALISHVWEGAEPAGGARGASEHGHSAGAGSGTAGAGAGEDGDAYEPFGPADPDDHDDPDGLGDLEAVARAIVEADPELAAHLPTRAQVRATRREIFGLGAAPAQGASASTQAATRSAPAAPFSDPGWESAFGPIEARTGDGTGADAGFGPDDGFGDFVSATAPGGADWGGASGDEEGPEAALDGLDRAFEKLRGMREMAQQLPEAERRALAARVALSFAAQVGRR